MGIITSRAQGLSNRHPGPQLVALAQAETWILSSPTSGDPSHPPRPRSNHPDPNTHRHTHFWVMLCFPVIIHPQRGPHGTHHQSCSLCSQCTPGNQTLSLGTQPPDSICPADPPLASGSPRPLLPFPGGILNVSNPSLLPSVLLRGRFGHQLRLLDEFSGTTRVIPVAAWNH